MREKISALLKKQVYMAVFIGVLAGVFMNLLYNMGKMQTMENTSYDWRFYLRNIWTEPKKPEDIVVVSWDDETFENMNTRYQDWPRDYHAKVISNLKKWGAKTIGVDILFIENSKDAKSDKLLLESLQQEGASVTMDSYLSASESETGTGGSLNLPNDMFIVPGVNFGFVNVRPDEDGFLRHSLLLSSFQDEPLLSFPVEVVRKHLGIPGGAEASYKRFSGEEVKPGEDLVKMEHGKYIKLGDKLTIPLDDTNSIYVNYRGPKGSIQRVPYYQVYEGTADPKLFKDKIVLVGIYTDTVDDIYFTPFSRLGGRSRVPGVECLAHVVYTILNQDFLKSVSKQTNTALIFAFGVLFALINIRFGFLVAPLISIFGAALYFVASAVLFSSSNIVTAVVVPDMTIILTSVGIMVYRGLTEQREKKRIHGLFSRYVTPAVAKELTENPDAVKMGGDMKNCSILFSDIRGFTNMSEKMTAPEVVEMLNDYLTEMTNVVFKHDGTLDKYIGDAVMAYWGAPLAHDDDPKRAVNTGLEMMVELKKLNERWAAEGKNRVVNIGVGVNTGDVVVGNMGSPQRTDFTVIGDHVNMASRLEGLTKEYGAPVLVTEPTYDAIKDSIPCRTVDIVRVKGKLQGIKIFEPFNMAEGDKEILTKILELSDKGIHHYLKKEWKEAIHVYKQVLELKPGDKVSDMFIKRCEAYMEEPPSADWDGVFTYTKK